MAVSTPYDASEADHPPRWGLGDAAVGFVLGFVVSSIAFTALAHGLGYTTREVADNRLPLWVLALSYPLLWLGFVAVPIWASRSKGRGIVADFGARIRWIDVPLGIAAGLVAQFVVVPLVSLPVLLLSGKDAA